MNIQTEDILTELLTCIFMISLSFCILFFPSFIYFFYFSFLSNRIFLQAEFFLETLTFKLKAKCVWSQCFGGMFYHHTQVEECFMN